MLLVSTSGYPKLFKNESQVLTDVDNDEYLSNIIQINKARIVKISHDF